MISLNIAFREITTTSSTRRRFIGIKKLPEQWVKFCEQNSVFFHAQIVIRRMRNQIHKIKLKIPKIK
ncbi:hypothetical protein MTR_7g025750 [Medicago truncatula]|uniref:Uncharacterized protein n=1 Tax=Medicago truncatula TaxID=3880 RepID=G7KZ00_MEDTR|nr:hypothetical protein MTR_7g025750 [Medicago truncatula]